MTTPTPWGDPQGGGGSQPASPRRSSTDSVADRIGAMSEWGGLYEAADWGQRELTATELQRRHFNTVFRVLHSAREALPPGQDIMALADAVRTTLEALGSIWYRLHRRVLTIHKTKVRLLRFVKLSRTRRVEALDAMLGAWTAYETNNQNRRRKTVSSLFQTNKVDKATALARTYARSTIAPQNIKRAVVWEHYWRLRTRASREIRRHREKIASLKHLRKETDAFMRAADIRGDHLTKIDCEIFILALQEPKFRFKFGESVPYKDLQQLATDAMTHAPPSALPGEPRLPAPGDTSSPATAMVWPVVPPQTWFGQDGPRPEPDSLPPLERPESPGKQHWRQVRLLRAGLTAFGAGGADAKAKAQAGAETGAVPAPQPEAVPASPSHKMSADKRDRKPDRAPQSPKHAPPAHDAFMTMPPPSPHSLPSLGSASPPGSPAQPKPGDPPPPPQPTASPAVPRRGPSRLSAPSSPTSSDPPFASPSFQSPGRPPPAGRTSSAYLDDPPQSPARGPPATGMRSSLKPPLLRQSSTGEEWGDLLMHLARRGSIPALGFESAEEIQERLLARLRQQRAPCAALQRGSSVALSRSSSTLPFHKSNSHQGLPPRPQSETISKVQRKGVPLVRATLDGPLPREPSANLATVLAGVPGGGAHQLVMTSKLVGSQCLADLRSTLFSPASAPKAPVNGDLSRLRHSVQ